MLRGCRAGAPRAQLEGAEAEPTEHPLQNSNPRAPRGSALHPSPQPPLAPTAPPLPLLAGSTVTTVGSYEGSEGCERKKGQRWGSLERRGMQAMEGEFSQEALFLPVPSSSSRPLTPGL